VSLGVGLLHEGQYAAIGTGVLLVGTGAAALLLATETPVQPTPMTVFVWIAIPLLSWIFGLVVGYLFGSHSVGIEVSRNTHTADVPPEERGRVSGVSDPDGIYIRIATANVDDCLDALERALS
jgi:F0F1-type ATP synthase membrane subunit c/vacuolar-type H+-ATPase subunit K